MVERILELMEKNGIKAAQLTSELGLPSSIVTEWRKGRNKPGTEAIIKIADYFGVSTDYLLLGGDVQMKKNENNMKVINFEPKYTDEPYADIFMTNPNSLPKWLREHYAREVGASFSVLLEKIAPYKTVAENQIRRQLVLDKASEMGFTTEEIGGWDLDELWGFIKDYPIVREIENVVDPKNQPPSKARMAEILKQHLPGLDDKDLHEVSVFISSNTEMLLELSNED